MDEPQPNSIILNKNYTFGIKFDDNKEIVLVKGILISTNQPAPFSPVWFGIIVDDEPNEILYVKITDVKYIKWEKPKVKVDVSWTDLVNLWKEYFTKMDELESFEATLNEYDLTEDSIFAVNNNFVKRSIIDDFKRSRGIIEETKGKK